MGFVERCTPQIFTHAVGDYTAIQTV
jgi:hypothetical protein